MENTDGRERRIHRRVSIGIPLEFSVYMSPQRYLSTTVNISRRGLCFTSTFPIEAGTNVDMQLRLFNGRILLRAEVLWSRPCDDAGTHHNGARILDATDQKEIDKYIDFYHKKLFFPHKRED